MRSLPILRSTAAAAVATTLCITLASTAGCSGAPASASYFPLDAGHRWVYEQTSTGENNTTERETVVLRNLGEDSLPGGGTAWHRRSESGVDYWLRADDSGIYRVASKNDAEEAPQPDKPPRYVLKLPLVVGTSWQASTTAYLLRRNAEFPPEIRHTHKPVPMNYQIAAIGQKLSTRAGDFSNCIQVRGQAVMKLFADPVVGFRDMQLTTTEWYCQGVGLVRLEREELTQNSTFLKGGTLVMELTEWQ